MWLTVLAGGMWEVKGLISENELGIKWIIW